MARSLFSKGMFTRRCRQLKVVKIVNTILSMEPTKNSVEWMPGQYLATSLCKETHSFPKAVNYVEVQVSAEHRGAVYQLFGISKLIYSYSTIQS